MMRVIVIGSGIAGLSLALALRRVGIEATIYERAPQLTEIGAGISLWANAFRALDCLGVGAAVRAACLPVNLSEFRTRNGHKIAGSFQTASFERQLATTPFLAMIHRADLVALLSKYLPADTAHYGFECVGAETQGSRAVVRFKNGHCDEADLVIGADGIRSAIRTTLFGATQPRYAGYTCWRGVCDRPSTVGPGYLAEWWGRGRRFGITTLPGDQVYWWATKNEPAFERGANERAAVTTAFQGWAGPVTEIIAATPAAAVLRNDILDRPPTRFWSKDRIGLIGDAAHPTTPNLGQGGCLAIEDAVALARHLSNGADPEAGLTSFAAERFPRTTAVTKESLRFGSIGQWEGRFATWGRDKAFELLLPLIGPKSMSKYAQFDVGHHPLVP
ncbi:MAG: FAD-dependent monooxygenase [Opitutus sp.]|nr:FAD-dependent monooxygenase [Opitutus sp.]MCS6246574.1 FAD-dependent monooxygenase [Opitutus sp.]MCS6272741.1 FAD-dependent monooxygenase [Opitutus sp.]MCS6276373.1 FAD-dependent monooxygenase [Opitutus sp.]MCS6301979.1 FAD-dependent monooxygenase [Opitutus sp.]